MARETCGEVQRGLRRFAVSRYEKYEKHLRECFKTRSFPFFVIVLDIGFMPLPSLLLCLLRELGLALPLRFDCLRSCLFERFSIRKITVFFSPKVNVHKK